MFGLNACDPHQTDERILEVQNRSDDLQPMSVKISIPDELYRRASKVAAEEGVSVDALFAAAFEQRLLELERLQAKATRGDYEKFQRVMSKAPAVEPAEEDRV
jgi:hypothetical protein